MFPNGYPPFNPYGTFGSMNMGMNTGMNMARNGGLFSRLSGGMKGINWSGILNGTSKTLGVINQAIPVVKQVGPMFNNMKSMLKVASLFKDETDPPARNNTNNTNNNKNNNNSINDVIEKENTITNNSYSNSPNFFI